MSRQSCTVADCDRPVRCRGWCGMHYSRWQRTGSPLGDQTRTPQGEPLRWLDALTASADERDPAECAVWPFGCTGCGYPAVLVDGRQRVAGEVVLERLVGPRPTPQHTVGHALHEICGDVKCVAPAHLSWQTPKEQKMNQRIDGTMTVPTGFEHWAARYSDDEIAVAVQRVADGESQSSVARSLGVSHRTVGYWVSGRYRT